MTSTIPILVPGAATDGTIVVEAPWDGVPIAEVETGGAEAVERALATAASAGEPLPLPERVANRHPAFDEPIDGVDADS